MCYHIYSSYTDSNKSLHIVIKHGMIKVLISRKCFRGEMKMSKRKEENKSPKEKALEHVTNCLKHRIAPYSELISASACLPELEVPKDIIERGSFP